MKHSIIFFFFLLILNCNPDPSSGFEIQIKSSGDKILIDDRISINIISPNKKIIDSIKYYLNDRLVSKEVKLVDYKVGENNVAAKIFSNNKIISINKKFDIYSNIEPEIMTYKVITEYNHDKNAYTQGLEFYNNQLYESSKEGWGLCNDGSFIYKSDGTNKIWVLDPETLKEIRFIEVLTNRSKIKNINELEYIDGKIYANTYQFNRDVVIVINPLNGVVEKVIDFSGIRDRVTQKPDLDVMNGIAYFDGKMFVTNITSVRPLAGTYYLMVLLGF